MAQMVKNPPAMQETWVRSLGWEEIPWKRAWQPTPVFLPGESPWMEEPGRLRSMGSQRVGHNWVTKHIISDRGKQCLGFIFSNDHGNKSRTTCSSRIGSLPYPHQKSRQRVYSTPTPAAPPWGQSGLWMTDSGRIALCDFPGSIIKGRNLWAFSWVSVLKHVPL